MYSEETIGKKLKLWATVMCTACIALCVAGALVSLIILFGTYPNLYGDEAEQLVKVTVSCIIAFGVTAALSPILFGGVYGLGVIVTELQEANRALKKSNDPEPPARSE